MHLFAWIKGLSKTPSLLTKSNGALIRIYKCALVASKITLLEAE